MSNELQLTKEKSIEKKQVFDPEVVAIIRKSICGDLSDSEVKVYLGMCRRYEADPIMKHIVPIVFNTKKGRVLNFFITRDFLLAKAHRSGLLDGMDSKIIRDEKTGAIIGATAEVWIKGCGHSFKAEANFKEYYNSTNPIWGTNPGAMISKTAEIIALKRATGIDLPSDVELEKNGFVQSENIELPKTKFTISDNGKINKKLIEGGVL